METRKTFVIGLMLCCLFFVNELAGQSFVKDVKITADETTVYFEKDPSRGYLLEIGGPEAYYWRKSVFNSAEIILKNLNAAGVSIHLSTHSQKLARSPGRVALKSGRLCWGGQPRAQFPGIAGSQQPKNTFDPNRS